MWNDLDMDWIMVSTGWIGSFVNVWNHKLNVIVNGTGCHKFDEVENTWITVGIDVRIDGLVPVIWIAIG